MSVLDNEIVQSYINFATQDGTVHDFASYLLLYGPVAIAVLLGVVIYQSAAMVVTGLWRTGRGAVSVSRAVTGRVRARAAAPVIAPAIARSGAAGTGAGAGHTAPAPVAVTIKRTPAKVG